MKNRSACAAETRNSDPPVNIESASARTIWGVDLDAFMAFLAKRLHRFQDGPVTSRRALDRAICEWCPLHIHINSKLRKWYMTYH